MFSIAFQFMTFQRVEGHIWAPMRENLVLEVCEQQRHRPASASSLISAFVIRLLERIISKLATREISIFLIVAVAEETGLNLALAEIPKTGFLATRPILCCCLFFLQINDNRIAFKYR